MVDVTVNVISNKYHVSSGLGYTPVSPYVADMVFARQVVSSSVLSAGVGEGHHQDPSQVFVCRWPWTGHGAGGWVVPEAGRLGAGLTLFRRLGTQDSVVPEAGGWVVPEAGGSGLTCSGGWEAGGWFVPEAGGWVVPEAGGSGLSCSGGWEAGGWVVPEAGGSGLSCSGGREAGGWVVPEAGGSGLSCSGGREAGGWVVPEAGGSGLSCSGGWGLGWLSALGR